MSSLTLAFAAVTLLSLVHIGTGVIVGTVPKWVLWNDSPGCGTDFISSSAECLQAAKKLGFTGRLNANRWDNKPPGCSSGTSGYVYFNENTEGTTGIASLRSICLYPGTAVIPEAFALTIPACKEEDNIVYYGHDFGYPNNTRVFPNGTVADCANWCGEVEECKFWTFEKTARKCWLKDDIGSDHRINNDRVSGSKECAAPPPDCGFAEHGITCCPTLTSGDNGLGSEQFLEERFATEETCWQSCKKQHPESVGITESTVNTYTNGKPKCWCEFGTAKLNQNGNYQACMFNKE